MSVILTVLAILVCVTVEAPPPPRPIPACGRVGLRCCISGSDFIFAPCVFAGECINGQCLCMQGTECSELDMCCQSDTDCCETAPFCVRDRCSTQPPPTAAPTPQPCGRVGLRCCMNADTTDGLCYSGECINGQCLCMREAECAEEYMCCESNRDCCAAAPFCVYDRCSIHFPLIPPGRPYNVLDNMHANLHANIIIDETNEKCGTLLTDADEGNTKYINALLSEHASIAAFNKFAIELMNLGAPLWFVELTQNAALDEINHSKIMLNILNDKVTPNNTETCIKIGKFPNHKLEFREDCNAISLDVVNGGCFGETISSMDTMVESIKINELESVAMDEATHSALAWISAKWMINNCQNIKIANVEWWQNALAQKPSVIENIFKVFWNFKGDDYQSLYKIVNDMLNAKLLSLN